MSIRVLIDTNILIEREDSHEIRKELSKIFKNISEKNYIICIHEKTKEDLLNDKDSYRKKVMLSKFNSYKNISNKHSYKEDESFLSKIKEPRNKNDIIDAEILYSLYVGNVNFIITEDKMIHKNALKLSLENYVFTINEFYEFINVKDNIHSPKLNKITVDQLNIDDPIFDTLKEDYDEFISWFKKIQNEHRPAFVYKHENEELSAILIYKENEEENIELKNEILPVKKRLKISTLYVSESRNKIGESLLKNIFRKAISMNIEEIYLTHFTKDDDTLIPFIEKYGFNLVGKNVRGEEVYLKNIDYDKFINTYFSSNNAEISTKYYPYYLDGKSIKKFIVPITPRYFHSLFDTSQKTIDDFNNNKFPEDLIQINAIQKAYISKSSTSLNKGDLLLFYVSDKKGLKEIGIVTDFFKSDNLEEIKSKIGKRSIFKDEEIKNQIDELKKNMKLSVTLFNHVKSIDVPYDMLYKKIDFKAPQTTQSISEENYLSIKELIK